MFMLSRLITLFVRKNTNCILIIIKHNIISLFLQLNKMSDVIAKSKIEDTNIGVSPVISLKPSQRSHYMKVAQLLGYDPFYDGFTSPVVLDISPTGTGKSVLESFLAALSGLKNLIIISPPTVGGFVWGKTSSWLNIENVYIYSYRDIIAIGEKKKYTKADLTVRSVDGQTYKITERFKQMMAEGVVLIFDEAEAIKNYGTSQSESARALAKAIHSQSPEQKNRIIYTSATASDKNEFLYVWLQHLGVLTEDSLYTTGRIRVNNSFKIIHYTDGLESIRKWVILNKKYIIRALFGEYGNNSETKFERVVNKLDKAIKKPAPPEEFTYPAIDSVYNSIVTKLFASSMPNIKNKRNLAYTLIIKEMFTLEEQKAIQYEIDTIYSFINKGKIVSNITKFLIFMEKQKAIKFVPIIDYLLKDEPHRKVVIQMNYIETADLLRDNLTVLGYGVAHIYGSEFVDGVRRIMSIKDREAQQKLFQEFNDDYRVMIITSVASVGVDFDDKSPRGIFPRVFLTPSSYLTSKMAQSMGRVWRIDSTSDSVCMLVLYSFEEKLIGRHNKKSKTLRKGAIAGSIQITENTPYAYYHPPTTITNNKIVMNKITKTNSGYCDYFTIIRKKDTEVRYDYDIKPPLRIGEFNEQAYKIYRELNPIDTTGFYTPKSPSVIKVEILATNKLYYDVIIATDLKIDTEHWFSLSLEEQKDQINDYHTRIARHNIVVDKIIGIEELDNTREVDYFYPGFREAKIGLGPSEEEIEAEKLEAID